MKPSPEIIGNWRFPSELASDDEFIHIGEDGRIVQFVFIDQSGDQVASMKLWCENLGGDRYMVRSKPGHEGWVVGMAPTETGMEIERDEDTVPNRIFKLTAATDEELPTWFAKRLDRALAKMIELEREANRTEHDGDGKPDPASS